MEKLQKRIILIKSKLMKEISIEEKAKAYDEAIKVAKSKIKNDKNHVLYEDDIIEIFPELKESSEDEKFRKYILKCCEETIHADDRGLELSMDTTKKLKNWLEKQGEQPTNKDEPKFHKGEWIVHYGTENIYQVVAVIDNQYQLKYGDNYTVQKCADIDKHARLWDVTKDAKDGDILACGDKVTDCPFIFHNLTKELNPRSYCGVNMLQHFQDNDENGGFWCHSDEVRPATKEQRDQLKKAMTDAGYTFDFEKKELNKIEQKPTDEVFLDFKKGDILYEQDTMSILLVYERNGSWLLTFCDYWIPKEKLHVEFPYERYGFVREMSLVPATKEQRDLLFSKIKEAGYEWNAEHKQLKKIEDESAWSEEDESNLDSAIYYIRREPYRESDVEPIVDWLKSLKERYTWKPSKEQIKGIECAIKTLQHQLNVGDNRLDSLYQDLKKLRKE